MYFLTGLLLSVIVIITNVHNVPLEYKSGSDVIKKSDFPEEGNLFEGDIILRSEQLEADLNRNLVRDPTSLWPGNILFYRFEPNEFSYIQKWQIKEALRDMMTETCIRFVERTTQQTFINVRNPGYGCAGAVGYHQYGALDLFLGGAGCQTRGTIQHEFLHALGFWHEHTRHDRDNYIRILWDNIKPGREINFFKRSPSEVLPITMPYDYGSVMHYRTTSFSKDYQSPTIVPFARGVAHKLGQRIRFSQVDIAKLNRLYHCPSRFYKGDDIINNSSIYGEIKNVAELIEIKPEVENNTYTVPLVDSDSLQNGTKLDTSIFKIPIPESVLALFEIGDKMPNITNPSESTVKTIINISEQTIAIPTNTKLNKIND